ncbi:MAG: NapC/NirT family cytochrome c [Pyrinomonadaceae bacterium]|nr:NapC/NirT family cytochrome c [Pyrinomonadaceae bacterium]
MSDKEEIVVSREETGEKPKMPSVFRNYISLVGAALAVTSLVSIVLLFLLELTSDDEKPYLGILIYIMLPGVMLFGIAIILLGGIWERRKRRKMSPEEILAYPILDLNGPRRRRIFFVFLTATVIFIFMSAFGSFRAYEFSESVTFCGQTCHTVMNPEFTAYNVSPHARVRCVECHVGSGAESYVRAKMGGVRQLYRVITDSYDRPIKTPVHNMRAASETCGKCHWTEKFHGDQIKVFNHYGYDEKNTLNQTRLLIKVGGGNPETGPVAGIHWHMNLGNEITFVSSDERRQDIAYIRMKDMNGKVVEYYDRETKMPQGEIEKAAQRKMDCIDCHNRPTHVYLSPNEAVDKSLEAGRLDLSLPFIKSKAVEVLSGNYATNAEAVAAIAKGIDEYYKTAYPDVYAAKKASVDFAVTETQRIYQTYFFPEMKTDWRAHPNNIGHLTVQGCFRCHDGQHFSKDGQVIRNECNVCHTTLDQTFGGKTITSTDGNFSHPLNLGDKGAWQCASCHKGNQAFKHPLNLGDISRFQCSECHKETKFKTN